MFAIVALAGRSYRPHESTASRLMRINKDVRVECPDPERQPFKAVTCQFSDGQVQAVRVKFEEVAVNRYIVNDDVAKKELPKEGNCFHMDYVDETQIEYSKTYWLFQFDDEIIPNTTKKLLPRLEVRSVIVPQGSDITRDTNIAAISNIGESLLPGGLVNADETSETAAIRYCVEQCGLSGDKLKVNKTLAFWDGKNDTITQYYQLTFNGDPESNEKVEWNKISQFVDYRFGYQTKFLLSYWLQSLNNGFW